MKSIGATTPSDVFSATVSTVAFKTCVSERFSVSRPTSMPICFLPASNPFVSRAVTTFFASFSRQRAAKHCQHMTLLTPKYAHGLSFHSPNRMPNAVPAEIRGTRIAMTSPAKKAPRSVFGKTRRSAFSESEMSFPMSTTGCGSRYGSPSTQSIRNPSNTDRSVSCQSVIGSPPLSRRSDR